MLLGAPTVADTVGEGVEDDMTARSDNNAFLIYPPSLEVRGADCLFCDFVATKR